MKDRDMFYGYGGFYPLNNQISPSYLFDDTNYNTSFFNDLNNRLDRLERQLKRLDQRLTRIEAPYANNIHSNEPDNNMYMM